MARQKKSAATSKKRAAKKSQSNSRHPLAVKSSDLRFRLRIEDNFQTTDDLEPLKGFIGQERAMKALELGLGIQGRGFNIVVTGLAGTERNEELYDWISSRVQGPNVPGDRIYIYNFKQPDQPRAIYLTAGKGVRLKEMMRSFVRSLRDGVPRAMRKDTFERERSRIRKKYDSQFDGLNEELAREATDKNLLVRSESDGNIVFVPIIEGKAMDDDAEFTRLSSEEQREIISNQGRLAQDFERVVRKQEELMRALDEELKQLERRFVEAIIKPELSAISRVFREAEVQAYLKEVEAHVLDNLENFKERESRPREVAEEDPFYEYDVNNVVDNSHSVGAPVVVEPTPTYLNLFGSIERVVDRHGRLVTNFTRIKAGSILKAHGGCLILNLDDAISEPNVWKTLKRTLVNGTIELETFEPLAMFSTSGIKPEPIGVETRVVVTVSYQLYELLSAMDEDFREIFKVHADFRPVIELNSESQRSYARWISQLCRKESLLHFDRGGVERLLELSARGAEDREKILVPHGDLADLMREAVYWARAGRSNRTTRKHVQQAIENRIWRSNRIEEYFRELISDKTLLIEVTGERIGQANALTVIQQGGFAFGRPTRVSASVGIGQGGIVNIERESKLSGRIHDKGQLILAGYMRNRYGQMKIPITLSASIGFEQSYSGVDGDSASCIELYVLLSAIGRRPLRQDLAVTGSMNQWGEVQAIGGINEKIEGWYDLCRHLGWTKSQGVILPHSNIRSLVLRQEVVDAVDAGEFHLYAIHHVDEGLELMSGTTAGSPDENGTLNHEIYVALEKMAHYRNPGEQREHGRDRERSSGHRRG